ncbi:MAG: hypothetical protein AB7K36_18180 [Chloroflexota bacterium]
MATDTRHQLHVLLDELRDDDLTAAQAFLEFLVTRKGDAAAKGDLADDPVLRAFLGAPEDDEDLSDEDVRAIDEGKADVAAGNVVTLAEIERRWPRRA